MMTIVQPEATEVVRIASCSDAEVIWRIDCPRVDQPVTRYPQIALAPGDCIVRIAAGGCAQTGGRGLTWKRYVDPAGPNSDRLYHGTVRLPGATFFMRISEIEASLPWIVRSQPPYGCELWLGYEDDDYADNGYREHDDGVGGQCAGAGNAWVEITVRRGGG